MGWPQRAAASVLWSIPDGNPDYWMSDAIVVRNTPTGGFDYNAMNPPELVWQDPIAGQLNWVWVRVGRDFALDVEQTGRLRLFIGRAGALFAAGDYEPYPPDPAPNPNILEPPETPTWTTDEWDTNLTGSKVVPVRTQMGPTWSPNTD